MTTEEDIARVGIYAFTPPPIGSGYPYTYAELTAETAVYIESCLDSARCATKTGHCERAGIYDAFAKGAYLLWNHLTARLGQQPDDKARLRALAGVAVAQD